MGRQEVRPELRSKPREPHRFGEFRQTKLVGFWGAEVENDGNSSSFCADYNARRTHVEPFFGLMVELFVWHLGTLKFSHQNQHGLLRRLLHMYVLC